MSDSMKKCLVCCELVNSEAIKCRYCGSFFTNNVFNKRHPQFASTVISLGFIVFLFSGLMYLKKMSIDPQSTNPQLAFNRSANEIIIQGDKIAYRKPGVAIIGEIKNNGNVNWHSIDVKAKLIDKNGAVVDILEKKIYGLRPGEVKSFKINSCCGDKAQPLEFETYEIFVEDAVVNRW